MTHSDGSLLLDKHQDKFGALLSLVQTLDSVRDMDKALDFATRNLSSVMDVRAISVKLLSEDGKFLTYAASHGLPPDFIRDRVVEVARSPLNKRIIEGEPYAAGKVTQREMFQFGEDLAASSIQSVLFVPLTVRHRVIGILGAYCVKPERFAPADVEFFRLAAGLVAMGIEAIRSHEAIERLMADRARFMMRVAHNLRAPLSAVLSMLDVIRGAHLGPLAEGQTDYLRRVDRRIRTLLALVNELLTLSTSRTVKRTPDMQVLDGNRLAERLFQTFVDEAAGKHIQFTVDVAPDLPHLRGNGDMVDQLLENLVSNAVKYTPEGGSVTVRFFREGNALIGMDVSDTGIGIPEEAKADLFSEFFRAENAREMEEIGTGLGLAIVKEYTDLLDGKITVESRLGSGTTFHVLLPRANEA